MKAETLRKSILQYAIQGKLVPQMSTEEPAKVLLEKIKAEKQELIKQGEIKKEKSLPTITEDEKPFDIPDSWEWVRFGELCYFQTGASFKKEQSNTVGKGIRVLRGGNINPLSYNLLDNDIYVPSELINDNILLKQNDIITPAVTSIENIGKAARIIKDYTDITVGGFVFIIRTFLNDDILSKYLMFSMFSTEIITQLKSFTKKSGQAFYNLGRDKFKNMPFPLPPFSEQNRIVSSIEKLMVLVDEYEKKEVELFLLEKEFPEKLKKSILQYAIQGKLVPQVETDEPASMLLEKIKIEKHELIKQGKIKKEKLLPPITENEKPFDIPGSWEWVRLGDLAEYKKGPFGSSLTKAMFVEKSSSTVKVYEQKNAIKKDYCLGDYYITQEKFETMQGFIACAGDIIVSCAGTIGETYILPDNAPTGIINQALMRIRIHNQDIVDYYLLYFDYIVTVAAKLGGNGSAIKNIPPLDELKNLLIPVPPIQEQKRIIERLKYVYTLIDIIASGKRLKKFNNDEIKPTITAKVFKLPIKENKPKVDVASLGMVARADSGVTQDDVNDMLRQVQSFYDKKN